MSRADDNDSEDDDDDDDNVDADDARQLCHHIITS